MRILKQGAQYPHRMGMAEEYFGQHRPGGPDFGTPFHDISQMFDSAYYDHPEWWLNSLDKNRNKEVINQLRSARGNPEHPVTMYRALPPEHIQNGQAHFNPGDWVTTTKGYAQEHAVNDDNPENDWPVVAATVPAKHLWTDNDAYEWGYHGPKIQGKLVQ